MLNENIRNLRKSKGLSQEELAIKNRRSKTFWKIVGIILLIILVLNILLVIFGMSVDSTISTEDSTTVIEMLKDDVIDAE